MIRLEDRQNMVQDIAAARSAGARLLPACLMVGITLRTRQRWQCAAGENGVVCAVCSKPLKNVYQGGHLVRSTSRA